MTEGELRKRIIDALYEQNKTRGVVYRRHVFKADADAVLAVLRPHLGLGVNDDDVSRIEQEAWKEWQRERDRSDGDRWAHDHQLQYDMLMNALDRAFAAIAGRGEVEGGMR